MPLEYRDEELDAAIQAYLQTRQVSQHAFASVLEGVADTVRSTSEVPAGPARAISGYRDLARRSVHDATDVLEQAELRGSRLPFVFFACLQDALSAVKMFTAAAVRDSGQIGEDFQVLFDATVARVMAVMHEGLALAKSGGVRGLVARQALADIDEVQRLVQRAGERIELGEGLQLLSALEEIGRRIAEKIGVRY